MDYAGPERSRRSDQSMVGFLKAESFYGYHPGLSIEEVNLACLGCLRHSFPGSHPAAGV